MPIEVPDTRAFAEPPPRRRRSTKAPATEVVVEPAVEAALEPVAVAEVAPAAEAARASAFSRPVRRRPRTAPEALAAIEPVVEVEPVPSPKPAGEVETISAPIVVARATEERRGGEGDVVEVATVTDTVVVRLGGTRYAVNMNVVAEVGRPPHVTRLPGVPSWLAGVANWRGRVLPVIDLRVLLGAATPELGVAGRILVLARDGVTLSFLAERVEGVVGLELDGLEPVLATLSRTTASVLAGQVTHPDGPIALLDLDMVFGLRSQLPRVRRAG